MKYDFLRGTGVALITPFNELFEVDYKALEIIINHLINGKVEYIVLLGTTAETATLSADEKKEIIRFCLEKINERVPVVIGMGGNNTSSIVDEITSFDFTGFSAILSVSPYYNKPSQEGIFQHYSMLAKNSPLPIILYNVPGRTSSNMSAETTLRLAHQFENIVAIKEASGNFEQCMEIIKNKPESFKVISGDDLFTFPLLCLGMEGVISVAAHANPKEFSDMVRTTLNGNLDAGKKIHYKLMEMMQLIFEEGNPGGIKALLALKHLCENNVRLPLMKASEELISKLSDLI